LCQLLCGLEACAAQSLAGKDAEPNLDLVEPACRGGREVEVNVGRSRYAEWIQSW